MHGVVQHRITLQSSSQRPQRGLVATRASTTHATIYKARRHSGNLQLQHLTYELVNALALPAEPAPVDLQRWSKNIDVLYDVHGAGGADRVRRALLANPSLLSADLELWHSFFVAGFGLPPDCFAKLASDCPLLLAEGDVFTAGSCMLFFKSMGWRNKDIAQRIIGYYPRLLLLDVARDIDPVIRFLEGMDCRGGDLKLLVWEFPRIFDKDYRRHVRKFQYLGMYGLSIHRNGGAAAGTNAAGGVSAAGGGGGEGPRGASGGSTLLAPSGR
ncbi:hypothetical protein PLESTB_000629600 [Pleodorina starrii]|uniref:Uncharacterized protein n=1 Tax=Pleodorina starrii TaxID=330485 RepID=A0A9W6BHU4_9CHLO|nr:hypothetical protein PLESTB_000629600 [Pleodorina starrii]GLC77536.1 hypothetical protein PLESTF_001952200 [Pleodorina starrii]